MHSSKVVQNQRKTKHKYSTQFRCSMSVMMEHTISAFDWYVENTVQLRKQSVFGKIAQSQDKSFVEMAQEYCPCLKAITHLICHPLMDHPHPCFGRPQTNNWFVVFHNIVLFTLILYANYWTFVNFLTHVPLKLCVCVSNFHNYSRVLAPVLYLQDTTYRWWLIYMRGYQMCCGVSRRKTFEVHTLQKHGLESSRM